MNGFRTGRKVLVTRPGKLPKGKENREFWKKEKKHQRNESAWWERDGEPLGRLGECWGKINKGEFRGEGTKKKGSGVASTPRGEKKGLEGGRVQLYLQT